MGLTGGCSQETPGNQSSQCSSFTHMTAQVDTLLTTNEPSIASTTPTPAIEAFQQLAKDGADAMNKRADRLDQAVKLVRALEVSEDLLKTLKTEYSETLQKAASATRSIADIYTSQSKATKETIGVLNSTEQYTAVSRAANTFSTETTQQAKIIGRLKTYCNTKSK